MEFVQGHNIYKTLETSLELSVYFEKHKIVQLVSKLLFELSKQRPSKVRLWLSENVKRYGYELLTTRTLLLTPPSFDTNKLLKKFDELYSIPTVVYTGERDKIGAVELMKKVDGYIKHYGLENKNKIFINIPRNCKEIRQFRERFIEPTNIIEIQPQLDCDQMELNMQALKEFEEVRSFYKNISRIIHYGSITPNTPNNLQNIHSITQKIVDISASTEISETSKNNSYCFRIVLFGRRGSGRKTQGLELAKRFNLIFLNTEDLIKKELLMDTGIGDALRSTFDAHGELSKLSIAAMIHKRIMQRDCIESGWVLIGYPYDLEGFQILIEKFLVPPNRLVFLHCRQRLALRRLIKRWEKNDRKAQLAQMTRTGKDDLQYIQQEMDFYNMNKSAIYKFLELKFPQTIHIDGNHSFETVKKSIFTKVFQQQNVIIKPVDLDLLYDNDHYVCQKPKINH